QRWCLMRDADMRKAGWVAQRFITPDNAEIVAAPAPAVTKPARPKAQPAQPTHEPYAPDPNIDPVDQATDLVRELYERQFQSENSSLPSAFDPSVSHHYFTSDIVAWLASGNVGAHP